MSSPNVSKVLIMLEELAAPYRLHHVNVFEGDQFTPAFQMLNPMGKVPIVVDADGEVRDQRVFESGAILIYLAERHKRFLPPTGPVRYEILEWLMVQLCNIGPVFGQFTHFRQLAPPGNDYALSRYGNLALRIYRMMDARLADRHWLAGEDYSIADMAAYPWMLYVDGHGIDWSHLPHLKRWCDVIGGRAAVQRASARTAQMRSADLEWMSKASPGQLDRFFGRSE